MRALLDGTWAECGAPEVTLFPKLPSAYTYLESKDHNTSQSECPDDRIEHQLSNIFAYGWYTLQNNKCSTGLESCHDYLTCYLIACCAQRPTSFHQHRFINQLAPQQRWSYHNRSIHVNLRAVDLAVARFVRNKKPGVWNNNARMLPQFSASQTIEQAPAFQKSKLNLRTSNIRIQKCKNIKGSGWPGSESPALAGMTPNTLHTETHYGAFYTVIIGWSLYVWQARLRNYILFWRVKILSLAIWADRPTSIWPCFVSHIPYKDLNPNMTLYTTGLAGPRLHVHVQCSAKTGIFIINIDTEGRNWKHLFKRSLVIDRRCHVCRLSLPPLPSLVTFDRPLLQCTQVLLPPLARSPMCWSAWAGWMRVIAVACPKMNRDAETSSIPQRQNGTTFLGRAGGRKKLRNWGKHPWAL